MSIPAGATHVVADVYGLSESSKAMNSKHPYRKHDGKEWLAYVDGEWCSVCFGDPARYQQLQKSWSGPEDGLPSACVEVDYYGEKCIVVGRVREGYVSAVILQGKDEWYYAELEDIKPILTAEQQAADQRESAIRELMDIAQVDCRVTAARLVDAGFKREGV